MVDGKVKIIVDNLDKVAGICDYYGLDPDKVEVSLHSADTKFYLRPSEEYAADIEDKNTVYHQLKSKVIGVVSWYDILK